MDGWFQMVLPRSKCWPNNQFKGNKIHYATLIKFYVQYHVVMIRAREIDKCKSVQPFHKQSAISVSFTETTDRPFPLSWKLPIGSFRNDRPFPNIR